MKYASILYEVKFICYLHLIVYGCSFFILCFSLSCSSNQKSESTGQSMKIEVTREPPKPSTDKNTPVSKPKPEPLVTPTTAQEIPTLRHRVVQSKIERKPSSQETITSLQPVPSRSHTAVTSTPKGMSFKIPIAPVTEPSVISPPRTGTDNHTGAREQTQPCTPTTGAPAQLCSFPTKLKRSSEKTIPEKTVSKGEIISKTPTETNPSSPPANGRKSKIVRKLKPLKITPDSSPLPPSGRKELERKVSESSIVSSNSDSASTGTDKSEEVETPSQVSLLINIAHTVCVSHCIRIMFEHLIVIVICIFCVLYMYMYMRKPLIFLYNNRKYTNACQVCTCFSSDMYMHVSTPFPT